MRLELIEFRECKEGKDRKERKLSLAANAPSQLEVLGHDCHTLGVERAEVGVLEERDEVGFGGFLQCTKSGTLELDSRVDALGYLADEALKW